MRSTPPDRKTPALPTPSASDPRRRRFLFALGASGVGAAAAVAAPLASAAGASVGADPQANGSGYRETEHVLDYYDSARL